MFTLIVIQTLQKENAVDGYEQGYQPFSDIPFWTVYDALVRVYSSNFDNPLYAPQMPSEPFPQPCECPYMEWQERLQNRRTGLRHLYPTQKQVH